MMIGRDESMPNRNPDLSSEERTEVRQIAADIQHLRRGGRAVHWEEGDLDLIARALLRYVPEGIPLSAPQAIAAADDRTTRATPPGMPAAGVICEPIDPEPSDGIVEPSQDDARTSVAQIDHTAMHRSQDGQAFIVKRGAAERIEIPSITDKTRR